jgi:putative membrane protein
MKQQVTFTAIACLIAGTPVVTALTPAGEKPATPPSAGQTKTTPATSGKTGQAGAGAPTTSGQGAATKGADAAFVHEAAIGGMAEVELGRVATQNASSDDVKQFGQRMVDDHGKAGDELKGLASKKNLTLPTGLDQKHQALRDRLAKLKGAAFDKAYMSEMVSDHQKDVAAFQREAKSGSDPDVKAWAQKTLPTLQEHLKMARDVSSKAAAGGMKGQAPQKKPSLNH